MPVFVYKAKKENAESVSGEIVAADMDAAIEAVSRLGLIPVSVAERASGTSGPALKVHTARAKDLFVFTRQLAGLLRSGVPILQAMEIYSRQNRHSSLGRILHEVALSVRNGRSFSASLQDFPRVFSDFYVAMVRAGEESGKLQEILASLALHFKKQNEILMKVRTAMVYPLFMLGVGTMTVLFILTVVMPRITVLFTDLHTALPWPTRFVMALSQGVARGWPVLVVVILLVAILMRSFDQVQKIKRGILRLVTLLPGAREMVLKVNMERFARTMGLLLSSGVPILKSLEIAIPMLDQDDLRKDLWACQSQVSGGSGFGEALRECASVPDGFSQLIRVGEESGDLAGSLKDIADSYEQEITEATKALTTVLEPAMILAVGLVVGFIVFAMLMPIFQMDIFAQ